jgi:hypothetical protein
MRASSTSWKKPGAPSDWSMGFETSRSGIESVWPQEIACFPTRMKKGPVA